MKIPTITCCVCGKHVTKRSSLFIGTGRACRDHDETAFWLQDQATQAAMRNAEESTRVLFCVESARVLLSMGYPMHLVLVNAKKSLSASGCHTLIPKVLESIRTLRPMTPDEVFDAIAMVPVLRDLKRRRVEPEEHAEEIIQSTVLDINP